MASSLVTSVSFNIAAHFQGNVQGLPALSVLRRTTFSRLSTSTEFGKCVSAAGLVRNGLPKGKSHIRRSPAWQAFKISAEALPSVDEQWKMVEDMKTQLAQSHSGLPKGKNGSNDSDLLLWFLKDRKFNTEKAVAKVAQAITWRTEFGVDSLTDAAVAAPAASGQALLHSSMDTKGRPVVIIVAAKHFPEANSLPAEQLCVHVVEQAVNKLPEGAEKILGIVDLRGFTTKNLDLGFVQFIVDLFFNYYPKRLGEVLFVDAPFLFKPVWALIKPMLKSYAELVRFCSADEVRDVYFTPETLPETFKVPK
eukprot:TRINITY_DN33406_c0_g1_i1.p1 TRINITY_DN33406_c0_g1~~TRINITY_DN33406_c0_g1_i1.p1  ORF type:complete len:308 (+),score=56.06 TRINITY_DN33406_c0_g1_i1:67-990(+)